MRRGRIFIYLALLLIVGLGAMYILVIRPGHMGQQGIIECIGAAETDTPDFSDNLTSVIFCAVR